jgi:hypothetical protein
VLPSLLPFCRSTHQLRHATQSTRTASSADSSFLADFFFGILHHSHCIFPSNQAACPSAGVCVCVQIGPTNRSAGGAATARWRSACCTPPLRSCRMQGGWRGARGRAPWRAWLPTSKCVDLLLLPLLLLLLRLLQSLAAFPDPRCWSPLCMTCVLCCAWC